MAISDDRRDRYRQIANRCRAIPGQHGLREHTVSVIYARTGGKYTGDGARWEQSKQILESGYPPKVRWLKNDELALGNLPSGTVEIGPITPRTSKGGGTALTLIDGSVLEVGAVELFRITGPQHPKGADYRKLTFNADRALRYIIRAEPVGTQR